MRQISVRFELVAAFAYLLRCIRHVQPVLQLAAVSVEVAVQQVGFSGAALVHQHQGAVLAQQFDVAGCGRGAKRIHGALSGPAGDSKQRVGRRRLALRGQHQDPQRDLAAVGQGPVLRNIQGPAHCVLLAVRGFAGGELERSMRVRSMAWCGAQEERKQQKYSW